MTDGTLAERQHEALVTCEKALTEAGWVLTRLNGPGSTFVMEKDGLRIVGGVHAYLIKDLPADVVARGRGEEVEVREVTENSAGEVTSVRWSKPTQGEVLLDNALEAVKAAKQDDATTE